MIEDHETPFCELNFWLFLIICLVLVVLAGITSGLALGLLSFSQVDLEDLIKAGCPGDKKNAGARILSIVKNGHFVLCTLLIGKSLAIEALPIFMDSITPVWYAILMSAPSVTIFTELQKAEIRKNERKYFVDLFTTSGGIRNVCSYLLLVSFDIQNSTYGDINENNRRKIVGWIIAFTCIEVFVLTYSALDINLVTLVKWHNVIVFLKLNIMLGLVASFVCQLCSAPLRAPKWYKHCTDH